MSPRPDTSAPRPARFDATGPLSPRQGHGGPDPDSLEELMRRADHAAVLTSLARGIGHDLRNPLQTFMLLVGFGDPSSGEPIPPKMWQAGAQAVERLTLAVTRFSMLYTPGESAAAPIVVTDLLRTLQDLQSMQRGFPSLEFALRVAHGLPAAAGIEAQVIHALLSLVINAKEALAGRDNGRIQLTAELEGDRIAIAVEDNGPGVPAVNRSRLFQPFFSTKPDPAGHGLGLAVARRLIERQGGTLTWERGAQTEGGRFVVHLPKWDAGTR